MAVANERQFRRAAEQLGVSQPALSAHLRELEEFLGVPLLSRTTRSVRLTAEGEKFLNRARNILSDLESAVLEVRDHATLKRGRITVAAIPSVASSILPPLVAEFSGRFPGIDVRMIELGARSVERSVEIGEANVGIASAPEQRGEFDFAFLFRDRYVGIVSRLNPLADRKEVPLQELLEFPFITTVPGTSIRATLEQVFAERGRALNVSHSVSQHQTILSMVAADLGVALLPSLAAAPHRKVSLISVVDPHITRDVGTLRRKGEAMSPAVEEFLGMLRGRSFPVP